MLFVWCKSQLAGDRSGEADNALPAAAILFGGDSVPSRCPVGCFGERLKQAEERSALAHEEAVFGKASDRSHRSCEPIA